MRPFADEVLLGAGPLAGAEGTPSREVLGVAAGSVSGVAPKRVSVGRWLEAFVEVPGLRRNGSRAAAAAGGGGGGGEVGPGIANLLRGLSPEIGTRVALVGEEDVTSREWVTTTTSATAATTTTTSATATPTTTTNTATPSPPERERERERQRETEREREEEEEEEEEEEKRRRRRRRGSNTQQYSGW